MLNENYFINMKLYLYIYKRSDYSKQHKLYSLCESYLNF